MKRKMKKLMSLFMIVTLSMCLICSNGIAYATETPIDLSMYSLYEIRAGVVPGVTWEQVSETMLEENKTARSPVVCVMRIYSDNTYDSSVGSGSKSSVVVGHVFLTFLNVSSGNITVGRATVAPNKMISVGKFGNFGVAADNFKGAFYNVETQRKEQLSFYSGAVSTYVDLTAAELSTVSSYLIDKQEGYSVGVENCAQFASRIWNNIVGTNSEKHIDVFSNPHAVKEEIQTVPGYTTGNGLMIASYSRCFYRGATRFLCGDPHIPGSF